MDGIRASIQSHTKGRGSRTTAAETFIKNVVLSCMFTIVKQKAEVNDRELQKMLGALTHQISSACAAVQDLIDNNLMVRS